MTQRRRAILRLLPSTRYSQGGVPDAGRASRLAAVFGPARPPWGGVIRPVTESPARSIRRAGGTDRDGTGTGTGLVKPRP